MSETQTARSRRRAGGRPPLRLDADHGALVAARRRPRDRRGARRARLGRRRRRLPRHDAPLSRPAVHDLGRRPDPEPRHEPEDREPDHPLRGGAPSGRGRERPHRRPAARQRLVAGDRHRGPGQERVAARRDHRRRTRRRQGREGGRLARRLRGRRRLDLRRPEDRAPRTSRSSRATPSSRTSTPASRTPSSSSRQIIADKTHLAPPTS